MRFIRSGLAFIAFSSLSSLAAAMGGQFGMEWSIDAPWRMEPFVGADGRAQYSAIPIVVEFADMNFEVDRGIAGSTAYKRIFVGSVEAMRIREYTEASPLVAVAETVVPVSAFQEIERKEKMSTRTNEPSHELCRPALGENCAHVLDMTRSHEFHAALWFRPKTALQPGMNLFLEVTLITWRPGSITDAVFGSHHQPGEKAPEKVHLEWTNYLAVHAGEAPLPRFGDEWLYGDLHYHSQMTDNEGETGYSYRNVARAMGAMGMDFVFTTDHASDSVQADGDGEARDLNAPRFARAKSILYGPDGVNRTIEREATAQGFSRAKGARVVPQLYMGEEVDVWPEISAEEYQAMNVAYGDHLLYPFTRMKLCSLPASGGTPGAQRPSDDICRQTYAKPSGARNSYLLYDTQGIPPSYDIEPSRQHLLYLPSSSSLNGDGFISSATGEFGGASKRLPPMLAEVERGGSAFLAHPLLEKGPGGPSGPDIVPYSELQLTDAWRSPAMLGLEFWNENTRVRTDVDASSTTVVSETPVPSDNWNTLYKFDWKLPYKAHRINAPRWGWEQFNLWRGIGEELYQGAVSWDKFLRKGLDPAQTASLSWLGRGEPRKWLMSGGSDAHGDLNFRRAGRPGCGTASLGRWCDADTKDTMLGNPRNLVSTLGRKTSGSGGLSTGAAVGGLKKYGNRQLMDALKTGNFSVSDGPIVRVMVDQNRNGIVEPTDFPMGSVVNFYPGEWIPILVEWFSTPEFGPIEQVDLYIGNTQVTFAPEDHGPLIVADYPGGNKKLGAYTKDPSGVLQVRLLDADTYQFNVPNVDSKAQYHGVARIFVAPGQFQLAEKDGALFYVRAFAKTINANRDWTRGKVCRYSADAGNHCGDRFAFANPVWGRYHKSCPQKPARPTPVETIFGAKPAEFLDSNNNQYPDICESVVLNPCERFPETGGPDLDAPRATAPAAGATGGHQRPGAAASAISESAGMATEEALAASGTKPTPTVSCKRVAAM